MYGEAARKMADQSAESPSDSRVPRAGPNDVFLAVMGTTGSGKSSFISVCTGQNVEIGHTLETCTTTVNVYSYHQRSPSRRVYLIDTPPFDDTNRSDTKVLREIATWLAASYQRNIRLHGIIYLYRITDGRIQGSTMRNVRLLRQMCGEDALKRVVLVTTVWDLVSPEEGSRREEALKEILEFWGVMPKKGSAVYRHNNTQRSARDIVSHFLRHKAPIILDLQRELVDQGKRLEETSVGREVTSQLLEKKGMWAEERKQIEEETGAAILEQDLKTKNLAVEGGDNMLILEKMQNDINKIRSTVNNLLAERERQVEEMGRLGKKDRENIQKVVINEKVLLDYLKKKVQQIAQGENHPHTQDPVDNIDAAYQEAQMGRHELQESKEITEVCRSIGSLPESSIFDKGDKSMGTLPSSINPPYSRPKKASLSFPVKPQPMVPEPGIGRDDFDTETIYSFDFGRDGQKPRYVQAFVDRLNHDILSVKGNSPISEIPKAYLDSVLKAFVWKLHGESRDPCQWGAAVNLRQKMKELLSLLHPEPADADDEDSVSEDAKEEERRERGSVEPLDIRSWIDNVEPSSLSLKNTHHRPEEHAHPFLSDYESFISQSDAYRWLLIKIQQYDQFEHGDPASMCEIGVKIRSQLRMQEPLRKISRRKSSLARIDIHFGWDPLPFFHSQGIDPTITGILDKILCLTGTWNEAQAETITDYLRQTWPVTAEHTISLVQTLLTLPQGQEAVYQAKRLNTIHLRACIESALCHISATGSPYLVSEVAEQMGWLASTLRVSSSSQGIVACTPRIKHINISTNNLTGPGVSVEGQCYLLFDCEWKAATQLASPGCCWAPLLPGAILVSGYPISRRPEIKTGLELSLGDMACLIESREVVQWGERLILKGFNSLLIATQVTASIVMWHLIFNTDFDKRISYADPRLDSLDIKFAEGNSLRGLENSRHIIGWCSSASDFCGHADANQDVLASNLPNLPASIVIDRLYIEAGTTVIGGLNMSINKKNQPFWLARADNYPRLIEWMSLQSVILYDVMERRAWLVNGASALLHLVRISLHRQGHNRYSPYEWLFDPKKLKDNWNKCTGLLRTIKTLTDWDNLDLPLYAKEKRGNEIQYATFGEEVKRVLHSFEILIDAQTKASSQDGVNILQTLDQRKRIVGFDILDVIDPFGPIQMRAKHLDLGRRGWIDFIPITGATTIFGNGFGDLIRPDEPQALCSNWRSVPSGMDYMATSTSTMKILYEKRLRRLTPNLGAGEVTSRLVWAARSPAPELCRCLGNATSRRSHHPELAQFLVSKLVLRQQSLTPVDIAKLEENAAVVFGHSSIMNWNSSRNVPETSQGSGGTDSLTPSSSSQGNQSSSAVGSSDTQPTGSTAITAPIVEPPSGQIPQGNSRRNKLWRWVKPRRGE